MAIKKDYVDCWNNKHNQDNSQYMKYISLKHILSYINQKIKTENCCTVEED